MALSSAAEPPLGTFGRSRGIKSRRFRTLPLVFFRRKLLRVFLLSSAAFCLIDSFVRSSSSTKEGTWRAGELSSIVGIDTTVSYPRPDAATWPPALTKKGCCCDLPLKEKSQLVDQ